MTQICAGTIPWNDYHNWAMRRVPSQKFLSLCMLGAFLGLGGGCSELLSFGSFGAAPSTIVVHDGAPAPDGDGGRYKPLTDASVDGDEANAPADAGLDSGDGARDSAVVDSAPPTCVSVPGYCALEFAGPCTQSWCAPASPEADDDGCVTVAAPDGTSCEGVFPCLNGETCRAGQCDVETGTNGCPEPEVGCMVAWCRDGAICEEEPDDSRCPDELLCDPSSPWVDESGCAPLSECVNDADCLRVEDPDCVVAACERGSCVYTPDHSRCPTPANRCTFMRCVMNSPGSGAGGCRLRHRLCLGTTNPCMRYGCDSDTGDCVAEPRPNRSCDDVFPCSRRDRCDTNGTCQPGEAPDRECCDRQRCGVNGDGCCPRGCLGRDADCGLIIGPIPVPLPEGGRPMSSL
jgi:hypothetical protein